MDLQQRIREHFAASAEVKRQAMEVLDRPIAAAVEAMVAALMNNGKGDLDHSAIVTFIEGMAGAEVKKPS